MRGGSWPNAPVGRPAAAAGPLTLRARPGSGRQPARGRGAQALAALSRQAVRRTGARTQAVPRSPGVGAGAGGGGRGRRGGWGTVAPSLGPRRSWAQHTASGDPGECCSRADCGAPSPASPAGALGREEGGEGCFFAGRRQEPGCLASAGAGAKDRCRARSAPAPRRFSKPAVLSGSSGFLVPRCPPPPSLRRLQLRP